MKERATFANELLSEKYFFESPDDYDEKTFRKKWKEKLQFYHRTDYSKK